MSDQPAAIKFARWLFYLNTAIWLAFGIYSLARLYRAGAAPNITLLVVAVLMFGNAVAMLLAGWGLGLLNRWLYYFAIAVVLLNLLLTFTDQFGLIDLITLLIDLAILVLLVLNRKHFYPGRTPERE